MFNTVRLGDATTGMLHSNEDPPAGSRIPKPFKKTLVDKMPTWTEKLKEEGMTDREVKEVIDGKIQKYIDKWGLKSRVGILLNSYNTSLVQSRLMQMNSARPKKSTVLNNMPGYSVPSKGAPKTPQSKRRTGSQVPLPSIDGSEK